MDSSDHSRLSVTSGGCGDEFADRLPRSATQRADQLAAMKEIGA